MEEILKYLKENGEQLDSEIAAGIGMSIEKVVLESQNYQRKAI